MSQLLCDLCVLLLSTKYQSKESIIGITEVTKWSLLFVTSLLKMKVVCYPFVLYQKIQITNVLQSVLRSPTENVLRSLKARSSINYVYKLVCMSGSCRSPEN